MVYIILARILLSKYNNWVCMKNVDYYILYLRWDSYYICKITIYRFCFFLYAWICYIEHNDWMIFHFLKMFIESTIMSSAYYQLLWNSIMHSLFRDELEVKIKRRNDNIKRFKGMWTKDDSTLKATRRFFQTSGRWKLLSQSRRKTHFILYTFFSLKTCTSVECPCTNKMQI